MSSTVENINDDFVIIKDGQVANRRDPIVPVYNLDTFLKAEVVDDELIKSAVEMTTELVEGGLYEWVPPMIEWLQQVDTSHDDPVEPLGIETPVESATDNAGAMTRRKLTDEQVREIRADNSSTHSALADRYGVSAPVISSVKARRTYADVK